MLKLALPFGAALAVLALLVAWIDLQFAINSLPLDLYILAIAILFVGLGIWLGNRLAPRPRDLAFAPNHDARAYLAISEREWEVLGLLADGHSNKVIARRLAISPNTVKTHVARLFEKLEVSSRTQAVGRGRALRLIP